MDIIFGDKAIMNGTQEKDTIKVIYCKGFKKLLNIKDCTSDKCKYHLDRKADEIKQDDKVIATNDKILCGYPKWETVMQICEVE